MKRFWLIVLLLAAGLTGWSQKTSAAPEKTRVLLILDCSQSMWDRWQSDSKIKVTQKVLLRFMDSLSHQSDIEVALRVFGHLNRDDFATRLEVPFEPGNGYKLQSKIKTLVPNGGCTATSALNSSANDFPNDKNSRNIILIITDGVGENDGDICALARQVQMSRKVVKTFILGIGDQQDFQDMDNCSGQFSFLPSEEYFDEMLHEVFNLSDQKARVTLSMTDDQGIRFETEVPVVFYDHQTHAVKYTNIYHYSPEDAVDTLDIDPLLRYDITFFTHPPITLLNRQFKGGKHSQVEVKAPQGKLKVRLKSGRIQFQQPSYPVIVRQHDSTQILSCQALDESQDYRIGRYDIDVMSLPVVHLNNIAIASGTSTDLMIPMPGQLALEKPKMATTGSVFAYKNGSLQWVCDLNPNNTTERLVLMPGEYQVVLKPKESSQYASSRTARFTITTAQQTAVNLEK